MIQIRIIEDIAAEHPRFVEWWKGHGWEGVPACVLPKLGVIAEDESEGIAAAWLYMDNSTGVSMLEWIVSNPSASPLTTAKAIRSIVEFMQLRAKSLGYGVMLSTCRQTSLSRLLVKSGFQVTDTDVIHHLTLL